MIAMVPPNASAGRRSRVRHQITPTTTNVIAIATVHVVAEHVVTTQALERGETMSDDAMRVVRDELKGAPLRRVLSPSQVRGGRVLRPIPAGAVVVPGAMIARRTIEPGDHVTHARTIRAHIHSIQSAIAIIIRFSVSETKPSGTLLEPPTQAHLSSRRSI